MRRAGRCFRPVARYPAAGGAAGPGLTDRRAALSRHTLPSLSRRAVPAPSPRSRHDWRTRSGPASSGASSMVMGSAVMRSPHEQPTDQLGFASGTTEALRGKPH